MRPRSAVLLCLLVLHGAACATGGGDLSTLPVADYAGQFNWTGDAYWFEPCAPVAGSERLWVTVTDRAAAQVAAARAEDRLVADRPVFVRLRAALTDERRVGPGGPALLAREVLELRPPVASDCRAGALR